MRLWRTTTSRASHPWRGCASGLACLRRGVPRASPPWRGRRQGCGAPARCPPGVVGLRGPAPSGRARSRGTLTSQDEHCTGHALRPRNDAPEQHPRATAPAHHRPRCRRHRPAPPAPGEPHVKHYSAVQCCIVQRSIARAVDDIVLHPRSRTASRASLYRNASYQYQLELYQ